VTITITPQGVSSNARGAYDGKDVKVGNWLGGSNYGYAFKIVSINRATSTTLDCNIEDVDNWNKLQDPSNNIDGGGPVPNSFGYIFQLNSYGLPELTQIPNFPNPVWSDQLVGRFASTSIIPKGPTGPAGQVDTSLSRNIGLFAYINDFTATYTYNSKNQVLTYTVTVFGNSSYYDMNFAYPPGTIQTNEPSSFSASNLTIFNNNPTPPTPQTNLVYKIPFTINPVYTPGTYTVTITIDTQKAGGYGTGSSVTRTIPIILPRADLMGSPYIVSCSPLGITGPTTTINGIAYYTGVSYILVPEYGLKVNNIYNVYDNRDFNYITFARGGTGEYPASTLVYVSPEPTYGGYMNFPNTSANAPYYNNNYYTPLKIYLVNSQSISAKLTNAKGATGSATLFPSQIFNTWVGNQSTIGYVSSIPNQTILPTTISNSIVLSSVTRYSIPTSETNPSTPDITKIQLFNLNSLTSRDPILNPLDGYLYASDLASFLNRTAVLPMPASPSFSPGTKYLLLKLACQDSMSVFYITITGTYVGLEDILVYWTNTGVDRWYSVQKIYTLPDGCLGGNISPNKFLVILNGGVSRSVSPGGDLYINIKFNGKISISDINVER
jgi:hypothetical protein